MLSAGPELSRSAGRASFEKKALDASLRFPRFSSNGSMSDGAPLYLVLREHGLTPGRERGDRWGVSGFCAEINLT
jgi:hypothetical protein